MTAAGLIGLFTGVLVRSAAAAITSVFGLLLVLPVLADKIPQDAVWRHTGGRRTADQESAVRSRG
jgi:ABC-2 type transport system permease protein